MKSTIIPGYKGIMPLDLSGVEQQYHKIMIDQHEKDIKEYNKYQSELPLRLRYENTTYKALRQIELDNSINYQRIRAFESEQRKRDIRLLNGNI